MKFPKKGDTQFSDEEIDVLEVWKKDLAQTPQGRKIIENFEKDPHVPDHICEQFFKNLITRIKEGDNSIDAIRLSIVNDMLLQGPPVKPKELGENLLRLETIRNLKNRYIKENLPFFNDKDSLEKIKILMENGSINIEKHFKDIKLQGIRPLVWATYAEAVENEFNLNDNIDELCDRLGLCDCNRCDDVAELRYDKNKVENYRLPTVIDAGENHVFNPSNEEDPVGYTWDLKNKREGFPEIIHNPIDIKKIDSIRYLGHKSRNSCDLFLDDSTIGEGT